MRGHLGQIRDCISQRKHTYCTLGRMEENTQEKTYIEGSF